MSVKEWEARTAQTRAELGRTLDAIEEKVNVPVQLRRGISAARANMAKQPMPWLVGAGAALAALTGWAIAAVLLTRD